MIISNFIGNVTELKIYFEGSGNPSEDHKIIGIGFIDRYNIKRRIGEIDKIINSDVEQDRREIKS